MASHIISSFAKFSEQFSEQPFMANGGEDRIAALKTYFKNGGVISVGRSNGDWPKLIYPPPRRLKDQIKDLQELRDKFAFQKKNWARTHSAAENYHLVNNVKKMAEPLYWKHMVKYATDFDYREDAKAVNLPAHLVADPRWKPMVKMFVNDIEYRKNLTETVQNSIVYKKDKRVAKYANELQAFRMERSSNEIEMIDKKIDNLDAQINTLQVIMKWAGRK
ncbi:MAG: hypothetical protein ABID38_01630 [Candidatus Diapherotrites archaeon]